PYDTENGTKLGTWEEAQAEIKAEAQAIVNQMKNQEVKDAFAREIGRNIGAKYVF
ncbi:cytochrome-c oxidase, cbb3-type subunit II, partial [Campylobacter coli]